MSSCPSPIKVPTLEKLKSLVQREQRLFVFLIFPQLSEAGVIFLNTSEHLFHILLGEIHQNRTSMRTVIGVVTLRKLIKELSG